jgi:gas vesicle protein
MNGRDERKILAAFLIGGILGAGFALLFAPQSGEKTRKNISKFAKKVKNEAKEKAEDIGESIEELVANISDRVSDAVSKGKELEEDAKKNILRAIESSQRMIEKQKSRLFSLLKNP